MISINLMIEKLHSKQFESKFFLVEGQSVNHWSMESSVRVIIFKKTLVYAS